MRTKTKAQPKEQFVTVLVERVKQPKNEPITVFVQPVEQPKNEPITVFVRDVEQPKNEPRDTGTEKKLRSVLHTLTTRGIAALNAAEAISADMPERDDLVRYVRRAVIALGLAEGTLW